MPKQSYISTDLARHFVWLTQRSLLPARSIEDPAGNIEATYVHGPLMEVALAYDILLPVENRKYRLSDERWINVGSCTLQAPEQLPGLAYALTIAVNSTAGSVISAKYLMI